MAGLSDDTCSIIQRSKICIFERKNYLTSFPMLVGCTSLSIGKEVKCLCPSFWTEVVIWQDWRVGGTLQVVPNVLVSHDESNLSNSILLRMKMGA